MRHDAFGLTVRCAWGITRHSMRTTTLASPPVDIGAVQTIRKVVLLVAITTVAALCLFTASRWSGNLHEVIEWTGLGLIFVCISGRTWCSLYIGGRKTSELVMTGPYSISRNPLYVFSFIGAVGVGAQLGAVSVALLAGACAWMVHLLVVKQEERLLLSEHGEKYRKYLAEVPRFFPRFALWKNVDLLEVHPRAVARTYLDACIFLAAIPVTAALDWLQHLGLIRVFLRLP
jgi:protein-S-isoprenylcysteine O-methyltransferase Ste14